MPNVWPAIRRLLPNLPPITPAEQARSCAGALVGILTVGLLGLVAERQMHGASALIPPMGASAVLLFALPASPLAQPWSVLAGNVVSATIGVACARFVPETVAAAALAAAAAIGAMFALRCLHPPSGAIALTAVLGGDKVTGAGFGFVLWPVAVGSAALLLAAIAYNRLNGRNYPHVVVAPAENPHGTRDAVPTERVGVREQDLDTVLRRHHDLLDVDRDELVSLFMEAENEAFGRLHRALTCGDVMSRDLATVGAGATLRDALRLLREHRFGALPVVTPERRLAGMLTHSDILRHADFEPPADSRRGLGRLVDRLARLRRGRATRVGEVMATDVRAVTADTPLWRLMPDMANGGAHHRPVVDADGVLVGLVSQSDVIGALFKRPPRDPVAVAG